MPTLVSNLRRFTRGRSSSAPAIRVAILPIFFALLSIALATPRASADVGVVLNESLDESMDRITGTGHMAVYFSNICAESPTKLRLCQPGENATVKTTSPDFATPPPAKPAAKPNGVKWSPPP